MSNKMARKSLLSFVFDADGSGANIHVAGWDTVLRFSYGRLGSAIRNEFFNYGVKQKFSDLVAGDLKSGVTPANIAREIERRINAAYNGQFNMRAAGQMVGDMVEAAVRLGAGTREECERRLLGMAAGDREKWAKKPAVASAIATVIAERMASLAENADPLGDDLFDI
jgi:hypothetical protein